MGARESAYLFGGPVAGLTAAVEVRLWSRPLSSLPHRPPEPSDTPGVAVRAAAARTGFSVHPFEPATLPSASSIPWPLTACPSIRPPPLHYCPIVVRPRAPGLYAVGVGEDSSQPPETSQPAEREHLLQILP